MISTEPSGKGSFVKTDLQPTVPYIFKKTFLWHGFMNFMVYYSVVSVVLGLCFRNPLVLMNIVILFFLNCCVCTVVSVNSQSKRSRERLQKNKVLPVVIFILTFIVFLFTLYGAIYSKLVVEGIIFYVLCTVPLVMSMLCFTQTVYLCFCGDEQVDVFLKTVEKVTTGIPTITKLRGKNEGLSKRSSDTCNVSQSGLLLENEERDIEVGIEENDAAKIMMEDEGIVISYSTSNE